MPYFLVFKLMVVQLKQNYSLATELHNNATALTGHVCKINRIRISCL